MKPGDAYRPFNLFNGSVVPFSLAARSDLSPGAKLLFGELAAMMGKTGYCRPSVEYLAERLGASVDQITRWLRELTAAGLIKAKRRGPGANAERIFIWHSWLAGSVKKTADLETAKIPVQAQSETAKTRVLNREICGSEPGNIPVAYKEEEVLLRGSSEEVSSFVKSGTSEPTDDECPSRDGNPKDRISAAQDRLQMARAAGLGIPLRDVQRPDRAITQQILEAVGPDFEAWLAGTIERGVARKAKTATYGLYLTDARNQAEDLRLRREAEEKRLADARIEHDRMLAAEAERLRAWDAPLGLREAVQDIEDHMRESRAGRLTIPGPLEARLVRTGEPISPNELLRLSREWKPCSQCRDLGTIGTALDRDLSFCECPAGIEAQHREGSDYCQREVERVHADDASLLAEACRLVGRNFASDVLERATVTDDGVRLVVTLASSRDGICITEQDLQEGLCRIHRERSVRIVKKAVA